MFEYYDGHDYLTRCEVSGLRADIQARKRGGARPLDGCNYRASVRRDGDGVILTSYYTDVARVDSDGFHKLWNGYSVTTLKHVNIFRALFGLAALNKKEWVTL